MGLRFHNDFHRSLYDNVQSYAANRDMWDNDDLTLYNSLHIQQGQVGQERKKWNEFLNHVKVRVVNAEQKVIWYKLRK